MFSARGWPLSSAVSSVALRGTPSECVSHISRISFRRSSRLSGPGVTATRDQSSAAQVALGKRPVGLWTRYEKDTVSAVAFCMYSGSRDAELKTAQSVPFLR